MALEYASFDESTYKSAPARQETALKYAYTHESLLYTMTNVKAINAFQQTLLAMTEDANKSTLGLIKLFLKNECTNSQYNMEQRDAVVSLYNFFMDSNISNFWPRLYEKYATNFMLQRVIDFVNCPTMSIQKICINNSIDTSIEYSQGNVYRSYLPSDPRPTGVTWYDYLHPKAEKISKEAFVNLLKDNNLLMAHNYDMWRLTQSAEYPSVQHICDGYFGTGMGFNELVGGV